MKGPLMASFDLGERLGVHEVAVFDAHSHGEIRRP